MTEPLFPNVVVKLVGEDGNAYTILGEVSRALKKDGRIGAASAFMQEATSGDYDHLLQTAMKFVTVE